MKRSRSFGPAQLVGALVNTMRGRSKSPYGSRSRSRGRSVKRTPSTVRKGGAKKAKYRSRSLSKMSVSRTRTATVPKRAQEASGQHNELSDSYISVWNGSVPKRYRGVVKGAIQHQYGNRFQSAFTSNQWIVTIGSIVTNPQMVFTSTSSGVASADSWPCNPYDLNPYQGTTLGNLLSGQIGPANDRCYFHTIKGEIDLTGLETIAQDIDLYLVKYKVTTNDDLPTVWNNVLDAASVGLGQPAAVQGGVAAAATYGRPDRIIYGQNWESHPTMRKSFKILAKRSCTLNPGSTHKFKYNIKYNRMMDKEYFAESTSNGQYMKGYSMQWVMRIKAAPVFETTTSKMTPGPVDVGFMHTYTVKVSFPMEKRIYAYRTDAGFISANTLTNDKIIVDTDTPTTVQQL